MDISATIAQICELRVISFADIVSIYLTLRGTKNAAMISPAVSDELDLTALLPDFHRILGPHKIYVEQEGFALWIINARHYTHYIHMLTQINNTKYENIKGELLSYCTPMNLFNSPVYKSSLFCRIKCTIETDAKETITFGVMGQKIIDKSVSQCDEYYNPFVNALLDFNTLPHVSFKITAMETVYSKTIDDMNPVIKCIVID